MMNFRDYLGLSNACSYDLDEVIGRADRFGFQNFCSPDFNYKQDNHIMFVDSQVVSFGDLLLISTLREITTFCL